MPAPRRRMALTAELVARAARVVEDAGPSPGAVYLTDTEYDALVPEPDLRTRRSAGYIRRRNPEAPFHSSFWTLTYLGFAVVLMAIFPPGRFSMRNFSQGPIAVRLAQQS